ncbi:hypothetical protein [Absidia glauca]|uniref:Nonsense-mediated mRNA decay factor SMG8 n=1 Tax=Absidia glauca TaxID=4829 RepID=A0A168LKG4_ABSGL|nr:hypothetical protein [Absidia glauca]
MDEINRLLRQTGLDEHTHLTIVSIFGNPILGSTSDGTHYSPSAIANTIVKKDVFVSRNQSGTLMLADDLQFYIDADSAIGYLFMDAQVPMDVVTSTLFATTADSNSDTKSKNLQKFMSGHQATTMRGFLLMLLVSHLVIPILPPSMLTSDFISTLATLGQAKHGIHTHLAQFQTYCWKHWDVAAPFSIFEKKEADSRRERERLNAHLTGWWGPAKGVPLMVFILANISIPNVENTNRSQLPVFMKKLQESLQAKMKFILRSIQLIPAASDNNVAHSNLEFRSLFCLPNDQYPFIHLMPNIPATLQPGDEDQALFGDIPPDINAFLSKIDSFASTMDFLSSAVPEPTHPVEKQTTKDSTNKRQVALMLEGYGGKILHQFTNHWIKVAKTRNPMHVQVIAQHSNRRQETKLTNVPLPTALHFYSALVPLLSLIYGLRYGESDNDDFKKQIMADHKSTRGMVQQIEVILRKKIKHTVEIEKVFSRSHSQSIMQKCLDAYLQDSPPYYPQQYHLLKSGNVLRLYNSLSRGPSAAEYGVRLQNECESVWKHGRQSCEVSSLTGKVCRLKIGHDKADEEKEDTTRTKRDNRALDLDTERHNSGYSFTQACSCGRSRRSREDPFDIKVVNHLFYEQFSCCLMDDHKAIDLAASTFGDQQHLVYEQELPHGDTSLLYLGPASTYRNTVGLERYEGYTDNTNYLLPWNLTTISELEALVAKRGQNDSTPVTQKQQEPLPTPKTEWPALGENTAVSSATAKSPPPPPPAASTEAFPALSTTKAAPVIPASGTPALPSVPSPHHHPKPTRDDRRRERRRRDGKRGYRLEGQIRGFLGVEYECPSGHRFLSCGDGRVCKLGHKGHPKTHANHFIHEDLPLYALCPCNFADYGHAKVNPDKLAQLQRIYVVVPDANVSVTMKPSVKIKRPGTDEILDYDFGIDAPVTLPRNGVYVFRLPFIYCDPKTEEMTPLAMDLETKLKNTIFEKGCFQVHF